MEQSLAVQAKAQTPRMTRILYVIDSLVAGGVESQMVDLIARLDRARFEPHALVFYGAPLRPPHFLPRLRELGVPVSLLDLGVGARDKLAGWRAVVAATWRLRPQIIQAENYHANLLTRAARPLMPRATRLIGTVRASGSPRQLAWERLLWRACDVIVASAGHLERQLIEDAGVAPERLALIANSIDVARFASLTADSARAVALRAELAARARRLLISMGRVARDKRPDLLASAVVLLKRDGWGPDDLRVALIGPVEHREAEDALEQVIAHERLGEMITRLGPVNDPEAYFAACDASILASPVEGLPVVALESLAAGKPVILSQGANASAIVEDGVTGWVARSNAPEDLAQALRAMALATDEQLAEMSGRCRAAAGRYDLAGLARRYMALYDALLAAPAAPPRDPALSAAPRSSGPRAGVAPGLDQQE